MVYSILVFYIDCTSWGEGGKIIGDSSLGKQAPLVFGFNHVNNNVNHLSGDPTASLFVDDRRVRQLRHPEVLRVRLRGPQVPTRAEGTAHIHRLFLLLLYVGT